jgi:hypothetical protein
MQELASLALAPFQRSHRLTGPQFWGLDETRPLFEQRLHGSSYRGCWLSERVAIRVRAQQFCAPVGGFYGGSSADAARAADGSL